MAQSPAFLYSDDDAVDYTPAAAVVGGDVVVQAGIVGITPTLLFRNTAIGYSSSFFETGFGFSVFVICPTFSSHSIVASTTTCCSWQTGASKRLIQPPNRSAA